LSKSHKGKPPEPKPLVGAVRHDTRGNAVWQWAATTARHAVASTSQLLRRLDASSLKLEELDENKPSKHTGFNPYDVAAIARAPAAKKPGSKKNPPAAVRRARPSWWRRLFQRR
jgi:hypothetical protein